MLTFKTMLLASHQKIPSVESFEREGRLVRPGLACGRHHIPEATNTDSSQRGTHINPLSGTLLEKHIEIKSLLNPRSLHPTSLVIPPQGATSAWEGRSRREA